MHESGDWQHQWVTREYALHLTNSDDRIIDQRPKPPEFEDIGWTRAFCCTATGDGQVGTRAGTGRVGRTRRAAVRKHSAPTKVPPFDSSASSVTPVLLM